MSGVAVVVVMSAILPQRTIKSRMSLHINTYGYYTLLYTQELYSI